MHIFITHKKTIYTCIFITYKNKIYTCIYLLQLGADEQKCSYLAKKIYTDVETYANTNGAYMMSIDEEEDEDFFESEIDDLVWEMEKLRPWGDRETFVRTAEIPEKFKEECR